jgi:hypothetical protein
MLLSNENHVSLLQTPKSILGQFLIPPLQNIVWQYTAPSVDMLIEKIRTLMQAMVECPFVSDIKRIQKTIKQTVAYWLFVHQFSWFNHLTVRFDDVRSKIHARSNIAFISENRQLTQLILLIFGQTTLINDIHVNATWNPPPIQPVECSCECYERHRPRPPHVDTKDPRQYLLVMEEIDKSNTYAAEQTNLLRHAAQKRGSRLTHHRLEITVGDYGLYVPNRIINPNRIIKRTSLYFEPVTINAPRAIEMVTEFWALMNTFKLNMTPTGIRQLEQALQVLIQ